MSCYETSQGDGAASLQNKGCESARSGVTQDVTDGKTFLVETLLLHFRCLTCGVTSPLLCLEMVVPTWHRWLPLLLSQIVCPLCPKCIHCCTQRNEIAADSMGVYFIYNC